MKPTRLLMIVGLPTINAAFSFIKNTGNNLCLSANSTASVVLASCSSISSSEQLWNVTKMGGDNVYSIENQETGTCLYVDYPITSGTPLALSTCALSGPYDPYQNHLVFQTNYASPTSVELQSHQWTNLCVDGSDGVTARLAECDSMVLSQQWVIG